MNEEVGRTGPEVTAGSERMLQPAEAAEPKSLLKPQYDQSWALVIGINDYPHMTGLDYAVNDAAGMADLLVSQLGFDRDRVFVILDPPPDAQSPNYDLTGTEATKTVLEEWLFTSLPDKVGPDDRVLVFFAGHGESRKLPGERFKGYLVPSDGRPGAWHTLIQMDDVIEAGDYYEAKHVFYLVDACFSGLAVARSGVEISRFEAGMLTSRARQALTAGTAKQTVADRGPGGHSLFTSFVLQGLGGEAAQKDTQVITASDLMLYVRSRVASHYGSTQTPDFGKLPGHESGADFLFRLPPAAKLVVDLSEWVPVHETKGPEIAAIATAAAMEVCLAQGGTPIRLDAKDLYARAKEHDRLAGEGTFLPPVIFVADFFGVHVAEPESGTGASRTYHARFHPVLSLDAIPLHLMEGRPVIASATVYQSWFSATNGEIPLPAEADRVQGGIVVTIARYDPNTDVFGLTPHWGVRWGDKGFGSMSRQVAEKLLKPDQMWAVEIKETRISPPEPVVP